MWFFRFIGYLTGYTKQVQAEQSWKNKYGEIPDRHCLVYKNGKYDLERIF